MAQRINKNFWMDFIAHLNEFMLQRYISKEKRV